jgi:hypothetical protein
MDRTAEAREVLAAALEMPSREKDDEEAKQRGRATLRSIR